MDLMATQAILIGHFRGVRRMTLAAFRHKRMLLAVAFGAGQFGMLALVLLQLGHLLGMAGKAGVGHVFGNADDLWRMWIVVTLQAIF
jgi:hypothetical protein